MFTILDDSNPILHQKCIEVALPISEEDKKIALAMVEHLKLSQDDDFALKNKIRSGVGLAAPQIGINKRMFAIYLEDDDGLHQYALINPKMKSSSIQKCHLNGGEGCLSVNKPHKGLVQRYYRVKFTGFDALQDKNIVIEAQGYLAIALQHEYDHLDGILFYERFNPINSFAVDKDSIVI